jgi:hypothetical protein
VKPTGEADAARREPRSPALAVHGDLPRTGTLEIADLEALGAEEVPWVFREEAHLYRALRVDRLLAHLGFERGAGGAQVAPRERRPGWRKLLVARGTDGFFALFTVAELSEEMGATRAYVAWQRDGAPLPGEEGPLRLVVTTDRRGSRSVRQLVALEVVDANELLLRSGN